MEYLDADEDLMYALQAFTLEHYATILRDKTMPAAIDPKIYITIGRTLSIWKLPEIEAMPTPMGLEFCKTRKNAASAIQGDYWDMCKRALLDLLQEQRAEINAEEFAYEAMEVFADNVLEILFYEEDAKIQNDCRHYLRERAEELQDRGCSWALQMDPKEERHPQETSTLTKLIEKLGAKARTEWEAQQEAWRFQMEQFNVRFALWWNTQMYRIYGPRSDKASDYHITLNEDYDSYPELEEDPLAFNDVQVWLANKLLSPKYPPAQVATLWRQMDNTFQFTEFWQTKLLTKIMGRIEDDNRPQYWVRKYLRVLKMDKLSNTMLKWLYDQAAVRRGHLVLQTALRRGISELEWQGHTPPAGHLVIRELFSPQHTGLKNVAINQWQNPLWPRVKQKFTELFEVASNSEIFARDRTFCQALKSQVAQAIRMNRVRLKDSIEAWRFLFFRVCHFSRGDAQIEFMDNWALNEASLFSGSRWVSRDVDHWHIRLRTGKQIHIYLSDEEGNSAQLRDLTIDLWRLLRQCQIAEIEKPDPNSPTNRHYLQAIYELRLQLEFLSVTLGEELPAEVRRWLKFAHWQNGPPFKIRKPSMEAEPALEPPADHSDRTVSHLAAPQNQQFLG
jgi:hypothetical protein